MIGKPGPLTGKVLGKRYLLGEVLGEGGFGMVYEAVQQDLGRTVAVKVLHEYRGDDLHALLRLELEARAAAGLEHPNIVQVTDFQHHQEEPAFLVMDLLRGCSLKAVLNDQGPISQRRAVYITCQVLSALMVAHTAGIVHRDLKPSNIFLIHVAGVKDIVKLLDFGIAKLQRSDLEVELTTTGSAPGTPVYMAPEQILGKDVDGRTDLYSMGVMLYRAVTGRLPFTAPNDNALVLAIMDHLYTPMSRHRQDLDPEFEAVVDRAMAKEPGDRFSSAQEMLMALMPWAPMGVRDDCLQGLRSSTTEQDAAFLYHVQDLAQPPPRQVSDEATTGAAGFNCATVTLPPEGRPLPPRQQGVSFFTEETRQKKPPTLEIVELLPDTPPVSSGARSPDASRLKPAPARAAPRTRWMLTLLMLLVVSLLGAGVTTLLLDSDDDGGEWPLYSDELIPRRPPEGVMAPAREAAEPSNAPLFGTCGESPPAAKSAAAPAPRPARTAPAPKKKNPQTTAARGSTTRGESRSQATTTLERARPKGTLLVKVMNKDGLVEGAMFRVDGKESYRSPKELTLPAGRHLLDTERPMRCTSRANEERKRSVKFVKVTCKGQGRIQKEVEVVAGETLTVILGPGVAEVAAGSKSL